MEQGTMGAASPMLHPHETVWQDHDGLAVSHRCHDGRTPRRETHGMGEALASSVLGAMITKHLSPSGL